MSQIEYNKRLQYISQQPTQNQDSLKGRIADKGFWGYAATLNESSSSLNGKE